MEIIISEKTKKALFIALFQNLKNCSSIVTILIDFDKLCIQGIDISHVCMFDIVIQQTWFDKYSVNEPITINVDAQTLFLIVSLSTDNSTICLNYNKSEPDTLSVKILCDQVKGDYTKLFNIPLIDFDYKFVTIPQEEYDAEFILNCKKFNELISQLIIFGTNFNIKCTLESIVMKSEGSQGEMTVAIDATEIEEYAIVEDETIDISFSLNNIYKMCLSNKISNNIALFISNDKPLKINYNIGEGSNISFFIAPKIVS